MTVTSMANTYLKSLSNYQYGASASSSTSEMKNIVNKYNEFNTNKSKIYSEYKELAKQYKGKDFLEAVNGNKNKVDTSDLKDSADKLMASGKDSLFTKDQKGNYDMNKIASAVTDFVKDYNNVKESISKSSNMQILEKGVFMTGTTKSYSNLLSDVGITVDSSNNLSVDAEKLKTSNVSTLKTLFTGSNSFGDRVSQKAEQIKALSEMPKNSYATYKNNGYINYTAVSSAGTLFDFFG